MLSGILDMRFFIFIFLLEVMIAGFAHADNYGWYTEGDFEPETRIKVTLTNSLNFSRRDCPVIISRNTLPIKDLNGNMVTVVDPQQQPIKKIPKEMQKLYSSYAFQAEANGHNLPCQLDDLDKDGIWDELFFMIDIKARETKTWAGNRIRMSRFLKKAYPSCPESRTYTH
ncbi:MAG TPA: DUF4861 domain-containing protein, partial [bacterium]|nr:DUF4861 domain-containing protein [bacterium]